MAQVLTAPTTEVGIRPASPDVSVCIANWNCVAMLRRCLQSLFDQPQGVSFEVVIADNGSTDGAAEMVAAEFPQVGLICNADNRGFARASNQAAAAARGRFLFFLNNDTLVPPNTLRRFLEVAEANIQDEKQRKIDESFNAKERKLRQIRSRVRVYAVLFPPLLPLISFVAPVIVSGNTVVALASEKMPYPAILFGEMLATSDLPGGVVNILTGLRQELLPTFATHTHVRAISAVADAAERKTLRLGAAESVKRVHFAEGDDADWLGERSQGVYAIREFLEFKSTWHPVGA